MINATLLEYGQKFKNYVSLVLIEEVNKPL